MTERRDRPTRGPGGVMAELGLDGSPMAVPEVPTFIRQLPAGRQAGGPPMAPLPAFYDDDDDDDDITLFVAGGSTPGRKASAPIRVYHLVRDPSSGTERRCWAFTITQASADQLAAGNALSSEGATYPDGRPCVEEGVDPLTVDVRCGSCGATRLPTVDLRLVAR